MPISVHKLPPLYNSAHKQFLWALLIDDIGSGTVTKKIVYQLLDENNNPITNAESVNPHQINTPYFLDFYRDVGSLVSTFIPNIRLGTSLITDDKIIKKVKLMHRELTLDSSDCSVVVGSENYTSLRNIINGVNQVYEADVFNNPVAVLSHQPLEVSQYVDTFNYLWIKGVTDVTLTAFDKTGATNVINNTTGSGVTIVPFNAYGTGMNAEDVVRLELYIEELDITYKAVIVKNCETQDYVNIMFLDSLGGRSTIALESVDSFQIDANYEIVERFRLDISAPTELADDVNNLTYGGLQIWDKRMRDTVNYSFSTQDSMQGREWLKAFLASAGYHAVFLKDGEYRLRKFILNSGQLIYHKTDERLTLNISGYFSHEYITQAYDRI